MIEVIFNGGESWFQINQVESGFATKLFNYDIDGDPEGVEQMDFGAIHHCRSDYLVQFLQKYLTGQRAWDPLFCVGDRQVQLRGSKENARYLLTTQNVSRIADQSGFPSVSSEEKQLEMMDFKTAIRAAMEMSLIHDR